MKKFRASENGFSIFMIIVVVLVLIIIGLSGYLVYKHSSDNKSKSSQTSSSDLKAEKVTSQGPSTTTTGVENSYRGQDAASIAAGIAQYEDNNNGVLPDAVAPGSAHNTLLICASTCTSGNSSSVILSYYQPKDVSYHAYASSLTVPNTSTVYIVNGAGCNDNQDGIVGSQNNPRSYVVIYAYQNGAAIAQECQGS